MKTSDKRFKIIFFAVALLTINNLHAQETWGAFDYLVTEQGYAGLKFRYKAFVRIEIDDADAVAALWIRVDRKNKSGFFNNMIAERPITTKEWTEFSIEGTLDEDYTQIVFGIMAMYNGNFYLDDVKLEVQTTDKRWKSIYRTGFEDGANNWRPGNPLFISKISNTKPNSGQSCFLIQSKEVPNYGTNSKVGKYVDINGVKLYHEVYGEGHPLVVLHGNDGSIKDAAMQYPDLVKKYRVIAIDSRGQGKSTDTEEPLTYEIMASDISRLLDELKIDSAFVWGHSDGAILGLILAMNHPTKVKKVLAFGANVQPDSNAVFTWFIEYNKKIAKESNDPKKRKLAKLMLEHPNISFSSLAKIHAPVLVMAGDKDVIRPEHTLKLFQSIPNSHLCILPGTTHGASWEKNDLFLNLLYDFFNKPFTAPTTEDWYK